MCPNMEIFTQFSQFCRLFRRRMRKKIIDNMEKESL